MRIRLGRRVVRPAAVRGLHCPATTSIYTYIYKNTYIRIRRVVVIGRAESPSPRCLLIAYAHTHNHDKTPFPFAATTRPPPPPPSSATRSPHHAREPPLRVHGRTAGRSRSRARRGPSSSSSSSTKAAAAAAEFENFSLLGHSVGTRFMFPPEAHIAPCRSAVRTLPPPPPPIPTTVRA